MDNLLIISETIFFFLASFVLIITIILLVILTYNTWRAVKFFKKIPEDFKKIFDQLKKDFIEKFSVREVVKSIFKKRKNKL